ncbi:hypothetical protein P3W85_07145 [Cupriavidus basilensis]|uniref:Uncharacterized protein n=1 Tax=Cupriavidus basilensis TaxID=68895 RepID=A0ABT6AK82_9BURK|nr:hypothetical protein [Cupriavidus basilensis]MDF3832722.1 hypothetical protein [Cupriavidus basilensis]
MILKMLLLLAAVACVTAINRRNLALGAAIASGHCPLTAFRHTVHAPAVSAIGHPERRALAVLAAEPAASGNRSVFDKAAMLANRDFVLNDCAARVVIEVLGMSGNAD